MTIKEMRSKTGLTQVQFAKMLGTSKRNIENWEEGKSNCPSYVLNLIEYYLSTRSFVFKRCWNCAFYEPIEFGIGHNVGEGICHIDDYCVPADDYCDDFFHVYEKDDADLIPFDENELPF